MRIATCSSICLLLFSTPVLAQPPGGGPPGGLRGPTPLSLLRQESVQSELKVSAEQLKKIAEVEAARREQMQDIFSLEEPERSQKIQALNQSSEKTLGTILSGDQDKRLKQILYQQLGADAFTNAQVAKAIGLSEDQQKKIRGISEEISRATRGMFQPGSPPVENLQTRMADLRRSASQRSLAILTAAQKKAWTELRGEPFKGQLAFGFPGGQGGPPGNRGSDPAVFHYRIYRAMPEAPIVKPKQSRKLLVYSKTVTFRHPSIPVGVRAITLMGDRTGAYEVYATEDESFFDAKKLNHFDAVLMLNTTGDCLRPATGSKEDRDQQEGELKKSLVEFVSSGKGLVGIHAATDTYHRWKEYNQMMGGVFDGHPWTKKVPVKNLETSHPLNAMFDGKDFEIDDEIYQFRLDSALPTERKFLLALDHGRMPDARRGNRKTDGPYPISWLSTYGKGRTFYCSLGHKEEVYTNPAILRHYLAGIQYALGDLEADASPTKVVEKK